MKTGRLHFSPARVVVGGLAIGLAALLLHEILASNTPRTASVQPLALIAPPATPPPITKEPEPERAEEIKELDTSDYTPGEPGADAGPGPDTGTPSDGAMGLDEAGSGGSDAFGLAGKPGGRELLLTGGGGGGGNPNGRFIHFADQLQSHLQDQLNQLPGLRHNCYTASIDVRLAGSGAVEDVRIRKSTGDPGLDTQLHDALLQVSPMDTPPPADMPWPIRMRMVSRLADCTSAGGKASNRALP